MAQNSPIRIELPLDIMFPSVNCYVVEGDVLSLIDCGCNTEENWILLSKALRELSYELKDIGQIIITHEHPDHIGLLHRLVTNTNAIIYAPRIMNQWLLNPESILPKYTAFVGQLFNRTGIDKSHVDHIINQLQQRGELRINIDSDRLKLFDDGNILTFGRGQWNAIYTPGHCPSQFVFYNELTREIIGSDMLLPIAPMPIITEDPDHLGRPVQALVQLLQSYALLQKLDIDKAYPGHGQVFYNIPTVIERQLSRITQRKEECYSAIESGLTTIFDINRKMYPYQKIPDNLSGFYMVMGYIDLLMNEYRITRTLTNGIYHYACSA